MRFSCVSCPATEVHDREFDALQAGWLRVTGWHDDMHGVFTAWLSPDCKPTMKISLSEQPSFEGVG